MNSRLPSITSQKRNGVPLCGRAGLSVLQQREEQVFLALTLLIGALTGLAVVAFIVLTERIGDAALPGR